MIGIEDEIQIGCLIIIHQVQEETEVRVRVLMQGDYPFLQNIIEIVHLIEEGSWLVLILALQVIAEKVGLLQRLMKRI